MAKKTHQGFPGLPYYKEEDGEGEEGAV